MSYVRLDLFDLALAALLLVLNGALSILLDLGLLRRLVLVSVRMVVQLALVGLVLTTLFENVSPWWTGLAALVMILVAGHEATSRQDRRLSGFWGYGIGASCMLFAAGLVTVYALTLLVSPEPWYHPRYALPLLGMVLGNTLTGISLGLQTLTSGLQRDKAGVEARLTLGATRQEALREPRRAALRSALMPILNAMAATGVVALPGMMTGQILAGVDPLDAVKYQVLVMFLIAGGTTLGAILAVQGACWRLTDARHRLRLDRLSAAKEN